MAKSINLDQMLLLAVRRVLDDWSVDGRPRNEIAAPRVDVPNGVNCAQLQHLCTGGRVVAGPHLSPCCNHQNWANWRSVNAELEHLPSSRLMPPQNQSMFHQFITPQDDLAVQGGGSHTVLPRIACRKCEISDQMSIPPCCPPLLPLDMDEQYFQGLQRLKILLLYIFSPPNLVNV
jgi:hypothetical protein